MDNLVYCLIRHRLISQLVKVQYVYYDIDTVIGEINQAKFLS